MILENGFKKWTTRWGQVNEHFLICVGVACFTYEFFLLSSTVFAYDTIEYLECDKPKAQIEIHDNLTNGIPADPMVFSIVKKDNNSYLLLQDNFTYSIRPGKNVTTFTDKTNSISFTKCLLKNSVSVLFQK